ncbi:MAG TPA: efflux RND transporter periplasmic adaptor subunit [Gemmatimonadaceae bacterium]
MTEGTRAGGTAARVNAKARRGVGLVLAAALLAACGSGNGQTPQNGGRGAGGERPPTPVGVAKAELGTAERTTSATGTVEAIRTVLVNAQLAGTVLRIYAEEGDTVRAGAVLARLDARELEAQLRSAEAALEVASRAAERAETLHAERIITAAEYERDRAAYVAALATRDQLRTRLGYATVRAPISGVVIQQRIEAGGAVGVQTPMFTVADISTLVVLAPVSELHVASLDPGDPVDVALDALAGRVLTGHIRRVFPSADTVTRLVPVEVALTGTAAREALPGFLARVTFHLDPRTGVLMVPAGAVVEDAGGAAVFVVRDGRASRRRVERGGTFEGRVEIVDGLFAGETVVVAGAAELRDGAAVRVVEEPSLPTDAATGAANGEVRTSDRSAAGGAAAGTAEAR